jgi:hypothetical protein
MIAPIKAAGYACCTTILDIKHAEIVAEQARTAPFLMNFP